MKHNLRPSAASQILKDIFPLNNWPLLLMILRQIIDNVIFLGFILSD